MRQRLAIARALLPEPSLLILDEPGTGLDPGGLHDLRALLHRLRAAGTTVFLSTHLLSEAEQLCDRIAVISGGTLVASGTVAEVSGTEGLEAAYLRLTGHHGSGAEGDGDDDTDGRADGSADNATDNATDDGADGDTDDIATPDQDRGETPHAHR